MTLKTECPFALASSSLQLSRWTSPETKVFLSEQGLGRENLGEDQELSARLFDFPVCARHDELPHVSEDWSAAVTYARLSTIIPIVLQSIE
jgi:hypothetical protein